MIPELNASNPIVNAAGLMTQVFRTWILTVVRESTIYGNGSPEGIVEAPQYALYIDRTGTTGAIAWRKMLPQVNGDKTQGWVLE